MWPPSCPAQARHRRGRRAGKAKCRKSTSSTSLLRKSSASVKRTVTDDAGNQAALPRRPEPPSRTASHAGPLRPAGPAIPSTCALRPAPRPGLQCPSAGIARTRSKPCPCAVCTAGHCAGRPGAALPSMPREPFPRRLRNFRVKLRLRWRPESSNRTFGLLPHDSDT